MSRSAFKLWPAATGGGALVALLLAVAPPAHAVTGDIHRVTADLANLRAGPSNDASVRGTLEGGDEVIELRRDRGWIGVRRMDTGEEGWIYGELLERVAASGLGGDDSDAGFRSISEGFDQLVRSLNDTLGYSMVEQVERAGEGALRVTPSPQWLRYAGREAHVMAAAAIYEMWKNHEDQRPVSVTLLGEGDDDYVTIDDRDGGPVLNIQPPGGEEATGTRG
jgi:hypothetical protein